MLVLSLKIGTNDCSIFKLNVGLRSLRMGFQNAPALGWNKETDAIFKPGMAQKNEETGERGAWPR